MGSKKETENLNLPPGLEEMMYQSMGFNSSNEMDDAMKEYSVFCEAADKAGEQIPSFREFQGQGNAASDVLSQLKAEMKGRDFQSIDEVNGFASQFMNRENEAPVDDF